MTKREVFWMLRRNNHPKEAAIVFIADFLQTTKEFARKIYEEEYLPYYEQSKI